MASWSLLRCLRDRLVITSEQISIRNSVDTFTRSGTYHWLGIGPTVLESEMIVSCCVYLVLLTGVYGVRCASKKAAGSSRNGRKSAGRRLGVKCGDGQ